MKFLLIVRHAKSGWDPAIPSDFDRTLSSRGKADAPEMAARIKGRGVLPEILVSSPAKRARKTAQLFGEVFGIGKNEIRLVENLYEPAPMAFFEAVSAIPDHINTVALFSHNPGITDFVNRLTETKIDDMPTCGVFAVKIKSAAWADFEEAEKEFWFFDYPKLAD